MRDTWWQSPRFVIHSFVFDTYFTYFLRQFFFLFSQIYFLRNKKILTQLVTFLFNTFPPASCQILSLFLKHYIVKLITCILSIFSFMFMFSRKFLLSLFQTLLRYSWGSLWALYYQKLRNLTTTYCECAIGVQALQVTCEREWTKQRSEIKLKRKSNCDIDSFCLKEDRTLL